MTTTWSLAIVGAGSGYTPSIALAAARIGAPTLDTLYLVDPDEQRLDLVCHHLRALLDAEQCEMVIHTHHELAGEAAHASVVVSLLRSGGLVSRRQDEIRATSNYILGQETQGWGGFVAGLRNVPVIRDVAKALLRARSSAWHIVVSNPVDITTHAACVVRPERTFGLCDMPWKVLRATAMAGGVPLSDLTYSYCGLNHLSWVAAVRDEDGKDVLGTIVDGPGLLDVFSATLGTDSRLAKGLVAVTRQLRAIPSPYLRYYYCATELIERARRAQTTRGEECESVQKYFEKACRDGDHALANNLARRRGGWGIGVTVARACAQVLGTEQATAIPCGPNRGIVGFLEDDAIVEAPRRLSDFAAVDEAQPLLHRHIRGLMSQVAAYEWLAADAATSGEFDSAVMAAASNPLIPSVDLARRLLAETIDEQKQWLPQFQ